jgi:hypothetical protein
MVIRHIGVWSVARLYGALCATMGLLFGAIVALIAVAGGMAGAALRNSDAGFASGGLGALFGAGAIVLMPICYGLLGLIMGAITAALYNLFAGMFGGIEMDVT